jgi:PRTRC genetic system protein A
MIVNHIFAKNAQLPPIADGVLYEYVAAGNGLFVRAQRPGLAAMVRIGNIGMRGLADVQPYCMVERRVPMRLFSWMLTRAYQVGHNEILFYLTGARPWTVNVPMQKVSSAGVIPLSYDAGADTLIELHSHNFMDAFFSATDTEDEKSGFRVYSVIGRLNSPHPQIITRVGIYGHFGAVPSMNVYEMPWIMEEVA